MSLKYVVEVFKLASKEVLGDYLSLEKFIELEKHLKSKTLNSEDTINLLNPQDIEFFIKVSKLAKARYFNDIEDVLTNLLFPYQDILKKISKYNNSYDKIIKFKILDRELFEEFCQIIESKEYKDSAWFEIYPLKTKITYEEIIKNLQELKGKIIEVLQKFNKIDVCNIKHFEYKNELWINVDMPDSVFTTEAWENKKLTTQSTLPNKSIIFVLNQGEKSFKMHTGSGKRFSKAMQEAFFKVNLKEDSVSNNFQASYDIQKIYLDILKNTNPFPKMIESENKSLICK
jgi:hypothetical protein